ncbi:ectoine/hydroxyectoine ABC transporter substrate-binding protein EhuB [Dietzia aerolata]|uniref:Ectoine/hydroxyectoine ABC transporter substrate-binding protein EhuB n=1 Tax=Dietzia aerolata TaxID=595984 RepID=A0ABV5JSR2_9ACTN|nr:ectoine/hydroxyectoine ABC transporter substrate-binding protein EhuB [Dietzia aerolata]MBB0968256.1 ectoine/hydroxyectoine ABC transporter substrate-binding protein EhuB [Dietzia aerolata]HIW69103.1 ectoine/hydroxyectoine ABC transporter substrate-binding protein EhuB [Candidatus Dietzia merdigallinarum]
MAPSVLKAPVSKAPVRARTKGALAVVAAAAMVLSGCSSTNTGDEEGSLLERLQDQGSVTVGFAGEAPYSFEENGELTGATVALHREIFGNLGIDTVEGVNADFGALIPGLQANRFDVVSAGMSILPERCEQAAFSEPEFNYTTALMVAEGNPMNLTDMQSVLDSGAKLSTMTGAIESDYASELGIDSTQVATPQDGMDAVTSGRADVFALTAISLNWMANNNPDAPVEVTESFVAEIDGVPQIGAGGTVFRTDDQELLDAYNEELAKITSDEEKYLEIVGEFGFTAEELPDPSLTTADLCAGE